MPDIDVVDSTWICAPPATVAAIVAEPSNWRRWWPDLVLDVQEWRGEKGVRWIVTSAPYRTAGTMEIWLEPSCEGVVLHYFLRLDAAGRRRLSPRKVRRVVDERRKGTKQLFWALSDQFEPTRTRRLNAPKPANPTR